MDIKVCDICKDKNKLAYTRSFFIERIADAAGAMENMYETLDLCIECELVVYRTSFLFAEKTHPELGLSGVILEEIKKRRKK